MVITVGIAVAMVFGTCLMMMQAWLFDQERQKWTEERRELLNRIQAPHVIPVAPQHFEMPEQAPDDWNLVGTIQNDPEQYLREDQ